jgi:hypothetical protein
MKKEFIYSVVMFICVVFTSACKKTQVGFLSPYIHYEVTPQIVPKGRNFQGLALNADGTSMPFTATVVHFYDKATGKMVDDIFSKKYAVKLWSGLYNPLTDTTVALINAKLQAVETTAVYINPQSGTLIANFGALNLPSGEYQYDLKITNENGTKVYPKIGDFVLKDTTDFDSAPAIGTVYNKLFKVGAEDTSSTAAVPILTITKTADAPNAITVQFMDKNGVFFDPKKGEIVRRPNTGLNPNPAYLQTFQDYTPSYTVTDNSMVFTYFFTPFPFISLGNSYNIYYRIPSQFAHFDESAFKDGVWSLNPRFPLRIYIPGSYTVTMQFPDVTHVP